MFIKITKTFSWHRYGGYPIVNFDGGRYPREMLPVISNQTELMLEKGYKSLTRLGPAPGHWFTTLASDKECDRGLGAEELLVAARAEYIIQDNLINIVPSFHNYQDIRTFFSVVTTQTFR